MQRNGITRMLSLTARSVLATSMDTIVSIEAGSAHAVWPSAELIQPCVQKQPGIFMLTLIEAMVAWQCAALSPAASCSQCREGV